MTTTFRAVAMTPGYRLALLRIIDAAKAAYVTLPVHLQEDIELVETVLAKTK